MQNNLQDNQKFIDDARERGEDTFMYMDPKSGECLLVSGSAASIRLLGEIVDDYETVCAVVEAVDTELLERWRLAACEGLEPSESSDEHRALKPENINSINSTKGIGESEHAQ
jgi:hypothetical protein